MANKKIHADDFSEKAHLRPLIGCTTPLEDELSKTAASIAPASNKFLFLHGNVGEILRESTVCKPAKNGRYNDPPSSLSSNLTKQSFWLAACSNSHLFPWTMRRLQMWRFELVRYCSIDPKSSLALHEVARTSKILQFHPGPSDSGCRRCAFQATASLDYFLQFACENIKRS